MPTLGSVTPVPTDATTQWGNALMQSGAYTYIYGDDFNAATNDFYGMKVARVALGDSLDTGAWQYWNGTQWVSGEGNAVRGPDDHRAHRRHAPAGWNRVTRPSRSRAGRVATPRWTWRTPAHRRAHGRRRHRCTPSPRSPSIPTRSPIWRPSIPSSRARADLIVSYAINTLNGLSALEQDVHQYQPQFLQLKTGS